VDSTPDEDRLRVAVRGASDRMAREYAVVMMPKEMVPALAQELPAVSARLEVVDDGEDDGIPVFGVRADSAAADPHLNLLRHKLRWDWGTFLLYAAVTVVMAAWAPAVLSGFILLTVQAGLCLHSRHQERDQCRRLQARVRGHGL
jgi:hypothetical protein